MQVPAAPSSLSIERCRPARLPALPPPTQIARGISARAHAAARTEATTVALERRLSSRRESMRLDSMTHAAGGEGPLPIAEEDGEMDLEAEVRQCSGPVCCLWFVRCSHASFSAV